MVPGFADDDEAELSNGLSPDQGKANQSELIEDPELNEIAQKLKELEASSESEEEVCKEESISEEIIVIEGGTKRIFCVDVKSAKKILGTKFHKSSCYNMKYLSIMFSF